MTDRLNVTVGDGKYTIIQVEEGRMKFLRWGEHWPAADNAFQFCGLILVMAQEIESLREQLEGKMFDKTQLQTDEKVVGDTVRKTYYGAGRQPWDDILAQGWGPEFAAGNVLKYIRRIKTPEDDLKKARWYAEELSKMCEKDDGSGYHFVAIDVATNLFGLLTDEEKESLKGALRVKEEVL